jgi:hypothetical protein
MDISVSKDAGLAFVTTYNSIQVFDLKDPSNPRLLNTIAQLPDPSGSVDASGNPVMIPLGETPALVEKGGWVYLANQSKGMRVLDLDPAILEQSCQDQIFCQEGNYTDYYPALGWRRILLRGRDTSWLGDTLLDSPARVKVTNADELKKEYGIEVTARINTSETQTNFNKGFVWFFVKGSPRLKAGTVIPLKFEIDMSTVPWLKTPARTTVNLRVRNNSNVTLLDVLTGQAIFLYDLNNRGMRDPNNNLEGSTKFYYIQELLNQVIPRKKSYVDTNGENYKLLEEDGLFDDSSSAALQTFKKNFGMEGIAGIGNSKVAFNNNGGYITYESLDDTSETFRKLMKDYSHISDPSESQPWLNKIVDRETLVGLNVRPTDFIINGEPGSGNDSGLFELYKLVVEKYVRAMLEEGERFAGVRGDVTENSAPKDGWTSRKIIVDKKNKNGIQKFTDL